jgi:GNAT superfamily N-acetyltransferase
VIKATIARTSLNPPIMIRAAACEDAALIFSFIQKKADFDRGLGAFTGVLHATEDRIRKTLFGAIPFSYVLFAESGSREIGFALYGFRFSSFAAQPSVWLDDLFVEDELRGQGVGAALMAELAQVAQVHDCTHLAWHADARNIDGLRFYQRLGAEITEQQGNRCVLHWIPWQLHR